LTVRLSVFRLEGVTMKLYDPVGREVHCLVDKRLEAGEYRYSLDTRGLARGCYALRLQVGATLRVVPVSVAY
jgi:hypothetical protein